MRHDGRVPLDPTPRPPSATPVPAPRAVLTVSGVDRPGVTARLFAALADGAPAVEVLDGVGSADASDDLLEDIDEDALLLP